MKCPISGYIKFMVVFGTRLKELRTEKHLSQQQLSQIFSVDRRTISNWENSLREPSLQTVVDIAKYFEVSADYLLGLEN